MDTEEGGVRLFNSFAAGVCSMGALYSAANGEAWWALLHASLAAGNLMLALRRVI